MEMNAYDCHYYDRNGNHRIFCCYARGHPPSQTANRGDGWQHLCRITGMVKVDNFDLNTMNHYRITIELTTTQTHLKSGSLTIADALELTKAKTCTFSANASHPLRTTTHGTDSTDRRPTD